jgi:hypothetical protein
LTANEWGEFLEGRCSPVLQTLDSLKLGSACDGNGRYSAQPEVLQPLQHILNAPDVRDPALGESEDVDRVDGLERTHQHEDRRWRDVSVGRCVRLNRGYPDT